jgi:Zn2+/Cd2+-exporting ATPase
MRTMGQTRGALKELLSSAPATAVVLRAGETVEVAAHEVRPGETVRVKASSASLSMAR